MITIALLFCASATIAAGVEPAAPRDKVPRVLTVSVGYAFIPSTGLALPPDTTGMDLHATYTWQVGGLSDGWPAWIGFIAGYSHYPAPEGQPSVAGLDYGVFAKHALWPQERFAFFLDYGLGAAQVWMKGRDGRGIGHLTRLGTGVDLPLAGGFGATIELSYKLVILASMAEEPEQESRTNLLHGIAFLLGATWGH